MNVSLSLEWYYVEADQKLEMNSNLNIIAKCYSVIYFGSITNSGLVNGIWIFLQRFLELIL